MPKRSTKNLRRYLLILIPFLLISVTVFAAYVFTDRTNYELGQSYIGLSEKIAHEKADGAGLDPYTVRRDDKILRIFVGGCDKDRVTFVVENGKVVAASTGRETCKK